MNTGVSMESQKAPALTPHATRSDPGTLLDGIHEAIVRIDSNWRVLAANRAAGELFGASPAAMLGRSLLSRLPDTGYASQLRKAVRHQGSRLRFESHLPRLGRCETRLYRDHDALTLLITDPFTDGAEAAAATDASAAELRRREARLALAQQVAGIGSWEWDVAANQMDWSAEQFRMLGLQPGELVPSYELFFEYIVPAERSRLQRRIRRAIATGDELCTEIEVHTARGGLRLWQIHAKVIYDPQGRPARLLGTSQDITERKQAERALRDSEERYRRLVELSPDATFVVSEGHIAYANAAALLLFGVAQAAAILGRSPLEFVQPAARAEFARTLQQVIRKARPVVSLEQHWCSADGRELEVEVAASPLPWEEATAVQVILHDITERKRSQRALAEANRRKDEFIAVLAHELRNPMAPIRNAALLLRRARVPEAQQHWAADVIERQVEHMRRLVDDLLDVARITRGRLDLKKAPLDLEDVVQRALDSVQIEIERRGHRLHVALPSPVPALYADPERLLQMLVNLLHNATKYTESGGEIALVVETQADTVLFRVRDNGIGMGPEQVAHIFEPFRQAEQSLARSQGGLGLGLTLVKRLAELHGGTVRASSDGLGCGSEFMVCLPQGNDSESGAAAGGADDPGAAGRGHCVLVVEDNADVARSFALLLSALGHDVHTAASGTEALAAVARIHPKVAFLDIGLPDMDGYEVARRLRAAHPPGELLLVALTGYGQRDDPNARSAGFDHYLLKPGDMDTIERLLEALP